jgi:hypothetical protein
MFYGSEAFRRRLGDAAAAGILALLGACATPTDPEDLTPGQAGHSIAARLATSGYAQSVAVRDSVAYLGQGEGGLFIASIADPRAPRKLAEIIEELRGYNGRLALRDSVVYIAAGDFGIGVVNAADPTRPGVTETNVGMRPARGLHVFGSYIFTAVSEQGFRIADLTEPTQPDVRGGRSTPGYARGLCTTPDSTRLLVACGEMGIAMFDIRDMAGGFGDYRLVSWLDSPGYAEDVVALSDTGHAALACGSAGVLIVDLRDTLGMHISATVPLFGSNAVARSAVLDGTLLYVAAERGGLQIIDVAVPDRPALIGAVPTPYALDVAVDSRCVYVADRTDGLIVIARPGAR